jgi:hypothetical protein
MQLKLPRHPREIIPAIAAIEWKLPRRPRDIAIAVGACLLVLISLTWCTMSLRKPQQTNLEYFTIDDGANYFSLSGTYFPPFNHDGKEAVQAFLYEGSDGRPFVGYMMKYSPNAQKALVAANDPNASVDSPVGEIRDEEKFYKRPGGGKWVNGADPAAPEIWVGVVDKKGKPAQRWRR